MESEQAQEQENYMRPTRRRGKASSAAPAPTSVLPTPAKKQRTGKRPEPAPVPEEVRKRFVQIKNVYFFADGAKAFTDRGNRLTTPSENTEVVRSLVAVAQARGWSEVVVRGSERFRREAWAAASKQGLQVRGYKPTAFEHSRLVRSMAGLSDRTAQETAAPEVPGMAERESRADRPEPATRSGLLTGTLVEHGPAPYRHDTGEPMSYYVKIETPKGNRTIWGVDLERALKESLTQPKAGDAVGLRSTRQDQVKVNAAHRDDEGKIVAREDLQTHRNRWIVEKPAFFEERARAARTLRDTSIDAKQGGRQHPELTGTYLQVHAAEVAAKRIRDPEDQKRFVEKVREALAASVARGEPLPPVRLREQRATEQRLRPVRTPEPAIARA